MQPSQSEKQPTKVLSEEQRQRQKKFIAYAIMVIVGALIMWLIFAPSPKEGAQAQSGFNTNVPTPIDNKLAGDKRTAYQEEQFAQKQEERQRQLQDLASMFGSSGDEQEVQSELAPKPSYNGGTTQTRERINASANAYKEINRTLGSFYQESKQDDQKEQMQQKIDDLNALLARSENHKPQTTMDDQVALMEKSYQLAAKYMPQTKGSGIVQPTAVVEVLKEQGVVVPVSQVRQAVVSGLVQPMSDSAFAANYTQERNHGFHTAVGLVEMPEKNTIRACVHENQTITDGGAVRLRLLEPMRVAGSVIPGNALITGLGKIQGERLGIKITSLEYQGLIIPVELTVVDSDGQEGIFIPSSMELDALKEVAANLGGNLGTTINLNQQNAGAQLLTDLGKGAIQGVSQYVSKKISQVKVHLKAGYRLMLYQKPN